MRFRRSQEREHRQQRSRLRTLLAATLAVLIACLVTALLAWSHWHGAAGWRIRGARGWFGLVTVVSGLISLVAIARAMPQREREVPYLGAMTTSLVTVCLLAVTAFVALIS